MYFEPETGTDTEVHFFAALNLLHSTDVNSAEMLRKMLDDSIAKKYGPGRTLAKRINGLGNMKDVTVKTRFPWNDTSRTYRKIQGSTNVGEITEFIEYDDEREDIPTISIPDEGSSAGDGALCKICNGSRIGPLILLECQECQDVYHPLCHQPPVLDLDIYDPRLVWHCAKCVEVSEAASIVVTSGIEDNKISRIQISPRISIIDNITVCDADDSDDHLNYFRRKKNQFQLRNTSIGIRRSAKRQTNTRIGESLKPGSTSSTLHLRKRVGSKLTVTRAIIK